MAPSSPGAGLTRKLPIAPMSSVLVCTAAASGFVMRRVFGAAAGTVSVGVVGPAQAARITRVTREEARAKREAMEFIASLSSADGRWRLRVRLPGNVALA